MPQEITYTIVAVAIIAIIGIIVLIQKRG
jgi:hypothetical protein